MLKLCLNTSEETEPWHPRIVLDETQNSELNELLTEINESAYKMPESPSKVWQYIESEMSNFIIDSENEVPDVVQIFNFIKRITFSCKMEPEIPIISLVYIEWLANSQNILINEENWKGVILTTLCLGSKIWDDDSLENEHFPKVLPEFPIKLFSTLEKTYLGLIDFKMKVKGSEYAKAMFTLISLADEEILRP